MSEFDCPVLKIENIASVPNSDALDLVRVWETNCIVRKGQLKVGDLAVYIPVEAVIPMDRPQFQGLGIKASDGKTTLRLKAVRLRGTYSEGLLVPLKEDRPIGYNMAPDWGIVKYEEPEPLNNINSKSPQEKDLPWAPKYNMENLLKCRSELAEGTEVVVTEKLHGCNARFVYGKDPHGVMRLNVGSHNTWKRPVYTDSPWKVKLKRAINRFWDKFKLVPTNNDVWWETAITLELEEKLKNYPNIVVYGEVFGKVQDLHYGVKNIDFRIFDVYDANSKEWWDFESVVELSIILGLQTVPVIYKGPYLRDVVDPLRNGKSVLDNATIREGIVIKPAETSGKKLAWKLVGEDYKLRKNGTEFH